MYKVMWVVLVITMMVIGSGSNIVCDTQYKCKEKVALNKMKCCKVCPQAVHVANERPEYGFYEYLEKDPNGLSSVGVPTERAIQDFRKKQKMKYEALKAADPKLNPSLKKELTDCSIPANDDFKLPCCMPCVGEYPNEAELKKREGFENKKQPPNGFNQRPQGPMLVAGEFEEPLDVPCCASGPSCCRWCPDLVCPRLELTKVFIEELYWSLCSQADESHRRRVQATLVENSAMNQLVEKGLFWDPRT